MFLLTDSCEERLAYHSQIALVGWTGEAVNAAGTDPSLEEVPVAEIAGLFL